MGIKVISALSATQMASSTQHIFLAVCTRKPRAILDTVAANPKIWREKNLTDAFIPGVNDQNFSRLGKATVKIAKDLGRDNHPFSWQTLSQFRCFLTALNWQYYQRGKSIMQDSSRSIVWQLSCVEFRLFLRLCT